jgi:hypothetical protein
MFYTLTVTCPLCGTTLERHTAWCQHVVAWMGADGFCSPLDGVPLPWLAGSQARRRWPAERVAEAFGNLAPLVDAYGEMADWRPGMSARVLWPLVAEALDGPVTALTSGDGEIAETYWIATEPEQIAAESRAIAALLSQGYDYLSRAADRGLSTFRAAIAMGAATDSAA